MTPMLAAALALLTLWSPPPARSGGLVRIAPHAYAWIATNDASSNSAAFVGDSIVLVVDPGLTPAVSAEFLAAVRTVTKRPIRYAVLTHWHPDHAFGVSCDPGRSFTVVAHGKTRRALAERAARMGGCTAAIPDSIVSERQRFDLGGRTVMVFHPGHAHTTGDLVAWEPSEKVLVTGDVFMHQASPDMGEARPTEWAAVLDSLVALGPRAVVAGHFGPSTPADLGRFRDYLRALTTQVTALVDGGAAPDQVAARLDLGAFADFGQYPQYDATFAGNARAVIRELSQRAAPPGTADGFRTIATLDLGLNPHQIAFSADGGTAYVAVAGSDRVALVDTWRYRVRGTISTPGTPLGVLPTPAGGLIVTRFQADSIVRYRLDNGTQDGSWPAGAIGASLFAPLPGHRALVSVERANRLLVVDAASGSIATGYPTGTRPFPPAATSDGRLAFVPNYDAGTVTVVDLFNGRVVDTVSVGSRPSGGIVLSGDIEYAVAVRGENRVAFVNTASHRVVGSLSDGIGESPFSVVESVDHRLLFVNNTASNDISVIAMPERRVVARIPVPATPIVIAPHPDGRTLWVSSEGDDRLTILEIPARWRATPPAADTGRTEVAVMGMIHSGHLTSQRWGLAEVAATVRRFKPDVVCAEIAPDRWERIWSDFTERGVIEDPRVRRFPEYYGALLAASATDGFRIEPCAAWTKEMSDLRDARIREFDTSPRWSAARGEYAVRLAAVRARYRDSLDAIDDPRVIHSAAYDEREREELSLYDEYQNDLIGPGGWSNINRGHLRLIDQVIRNNRGKRVLITFGAGHKYPFLDHLRTRPDVTLLDLDASLP
ncbi:MAG: MBL fold metallo-hydrolase [Gemmatimonadales bacterium]